MKLILEPTLEDYVKVMDNLTIDFYNQRSDSIFPSYLEPEGGTQFIYLQSSDIAMITNGELHLVRCGKEKEKAEKVFERLKKILEIAQHLEGGFCPRLVELACGDIPVKSEIKEAIKQCGECEDETCLFEDYLKQKGLYEKLDLKSTHSDNTGRVWKL